MPESPDLALYELAPPIKCQRTQATSVLFVYTAAGKSLIAANNSPANFKHDIINYNTPFDRVCCELSHLDHFAVALSQPRQQRLLRLLRPRALQAFIDGSARRFVQLELWHQTCLVSAQCADYNKWKNSGAPAFTCKAGCRFSVRGCPDGVQCWMGANALSTPWPSPSVDRMSWWLGPAPCSSCALDGSSITVGCRIGI